MQQLLLVASQRDAQGRQVSGGEGADPEPASPRPQGRPWPALASGPEAPTPPLPAYSRLSRATSLKVQRPHLEKVSW